MSSSSEAKSSAANKASAVVPVHSAQASGSFSVEQTNPLQDLAQGAAQGSTLARGRNNYMQRAASSSGTVTVHEGVAMSKVVADLQQTQGVFKLLWVFIVTVVLYNMTYGIATLAGASNAASIVNRVLDGADESAADGDTLMTFFKEKLVDEFLDPSGEVRLRAMAAGMGELGKDLSFDDFATEGRGKKFIGLGVDRSTTILKYVIFWMMVFIFTIVMANLLIAVISDAYEEARGERDETRQRISAPVIILRKAWSIIMTPVYGVWYYRKRDTSSVVWRGNIVMEKWRRALPDGWRGTSATERGCARAVERSPKILQMEKSIKKIETNMKEQIAEVKNDIGEIKQMMRALLERR
eukprot:g5242.t1